MNTISKIHTMLLRDPADMTKALGDNPEIRQLLRYYKKCIRHGIHLWNDVPVTHKYVVLTKNPHLQTLLYARNPTKEVVIHRIFDNYSFVVMPNNFIFEKLYDEENWQLTYVDPYRDMYKQFRNLPRQSENPEADECLVEHDGLMIRPESVERLNDVKSLVKMHLEINL